MAQTINVANIKIGMAVDGSEFTRKQIRDVNTMLRESEAPASKFDTSMRLLEKAFREGGISMQQFVQAEQHLLAKLAQGEAAARRQSEALHGLSRSTQQVTQSSSGLSAAFGAQQSAMSAIQGQIAGFVGIAAAIGGIKKSIQFASELETNKIAFEVMTGSASKAETMLRQFKALDVQSPINYGEFATAGKTLLQFGMTAESVPPTLQRLSAISLGNAEQFKSLALAFGQTQAAGRLMGQEVLQFINAGFNPLQEISRTTGISMVELKKRMEDGAISAQMVATAFKTATEEGGLFYGMNEKLSQSMAGQWAKLEGDIKAAAVTLGQDLMPLIKQTVGMIRDGFGGGEGGGDRGVIGYNVKGISDAFASVLAGAQAASTEASKSLKVGNAVGYFNALSAGLNATIDKHQEIIDGELDREAALIRAKNEEGEIAKKKQETQAEVLKLAEAEKQRAQAERDRLEKLKNETEHYKKMGSEMWNLRDKLNRLTLGEDEARRQKQAREGYTADDIARIDNMQKMIDAEQQRADMLKESQAIEKEMLSDKQKAINEIQRLQGIYDQMTVEQKTGSLGQANLAKQEQVRQRFAQTQSTADIAKNIAPAMRAGSKEAASFLLQQRTDAAEKAERKKWQDQLLTETRRGNDMMRDGQFIKKAR